FRRFLILLSYHAGTIAAPDNRPRPVLGRRMKMPRPRSRSRVNVRTGCRVELLEDRTLLSTIHWINRGVTSGIDDDGFNTFFGASAEMPRKVVDAALMRRQNALVNFDRPDSPLGN